MPAVLRRAGLKLTPQRLAIVRALSGDDTHPTAQELFERLRPQLPGMSFATVYNTLAALAAAGLCSARSFSVGRPGRPGAAARGATRFDPNMQPHDHAVCDACGAVYDVRRAEPGPREAEPTTPPGFAVRAVEHVYRGQCGACRRAPVGRAARPQRQPNRPTT
ncbi:MAG: transcriptional repressor [Polyangiaceae bacterium]|nr:transcriptional repressor [Polyangiaceae bacterium]